MASSSVPSPPVFEICGARIPLDGIDLPECVTIMHCIPEICKAVDRSTGDFTIIFGEKQQLGHTDLLSSRVPFFRSLFKSEMTESTIGVVNLSSKLCQFDATTIKSLLEYAYTGCIAISVMNVQDVMMGAAYLQIESLIEECGRFMRKRVNVDNALPLLFFFNSISHNKNDEFLLKFIDKNFVPISHTPEFIDLPVNELVLLLQRDTLHVDDEKQVFEAVMRWIGDDHDRTKNASSLLKCVRCNHLSKDFIAEIVDKTIWVENNYDCVSHINQAKEYIDNFDMRSKSKSFNNSKRICDEVHTLLFFIGTREENINSQEDNVEMYDPISNSWTKCKNMKKTSATSLAIIGTKFYFYGSFIDAVHSENSEYYDILSNEWFSMPNLPMRRNYFTSGVLDGKIYVVGGTDGSNILTKMEIFDPSTNVWSPAKSMTKPRNVCSSRVLNGKIYVFGGIDDNYDILEDGEVYDPETDNWTPIASMRYSRRVFSSALLNGQIYVAGGVNNGVILDYVERYDPNTNLWTTLNSLKTARYFGKLLVSCGKMFMIGGYENFLQQDAKIESNLLEIYHPETDTWEDRTLWPRISDAFFCALPVPATTISSSANLEQIFGSSHSNGFPSFLLNDKLIQSIAENGYANPSEMQDFCIPHAIRGMNVICQSKPGTGKTTSYIISTLQQIESIEGFVSVLVLCQSRKQVAKISEMYGRFTAKLPNVKIATFCADVKVKENEFLLKTSCPNIVIGTTGRILALQNSGALNLGKIKSIVVDDFHKIMENPSMIKDVEKIISFTPQGTNLLMFSSSLQRKTFEACKNLLSEDSQICQYLGL